MSLSEEQKAEVREAAELFWAWQLGKGPRPLDDVKADMQVFGMLMYRAFGAEALEELRVQLKATAPIVEDLLTDPPDG